MSAVLSPEEKKLLLVLARQALECAVRAGRLPADAPAGLTPALRAAGASFVTLTKHGQLRGCIGTLEAHQPLWQDVREHAVAAAIQDNRFPPVQPDELAAIEIEVSHLTPPEPLVYADAADLLARLRPGVDGVILSENRWRRATFLPQVWQKIPDPAEFLDNLCYKMGSAPDAWRRQHLDVQIYQVEEFHE
jgi:hypothetical protein